MDYSFLKHRLRDAAVHKRTELGADFARYAARDLPQIADSLPMPQSPVVSAYWALKTELDLRPLMNAFYDKGVPVCLPVVTGKRESLLFRLWSPQAELVKGLYGTEQPDEKYETVEPNVLFLPLLAFDRQGGRLGYGGGFYDRTVHELRAKNPDVIVVGTGFSAQEIDEVPVEDTDEKMDWILTESELIKVK